MFFWFVNSLVIGPADIFTKPFMKPLDKSTFVRLRSVLMNTNGSYREPLILALKTMRGEARSLATRLLGRF